VRCEVCKPWFKSSVVCLVSADIANYPMDTGRLQQWRCVVYKRFSLTTLVLGSAVVSRVSTLAASPAESGVPLARSHSHSVPALQPRMS
jgi:hypothetical protein